MKLHHLVLLIFCFLCTSIIIPGQENKADIIDTNNKGSIIPFTIYNNKTILLVKIGDVRPLRIILDSGMDWDGLLIYNHGMQNSVKLIKPHNAFLGGAGNGSSQSVLFSDSMSFSIGNIEFKNQRVVILQSDHFKRSPTDGVIGYSLFGHSAVEINYDDSIVTLHDPGNLQVDSSWKVIPIYFKENKIPWINVDLVINNEAPVTISCYIDYASSEAIELLQKPGQKFKIPEVTENVYLGRGLSGDIYGKRGNISKVILGPFELKNVRAAFAPAEVRSKQKNADGVIAGSLLRKFNLIFDYADKKLYLKPNSGF